MSRVLSSDALISAYVYTKHHRRPEKKILSPSVGTSALFETKHVFSLLTEDIFLFLGTSLYYGTNMSAKGIYVGLLFPGTMLYHEI